MQANTLDEEAVTVVGFRQRHRHGPCASAFQLVDSFALSGCGVSQLTYGRYPVPVPETTNCGFLRKSPRGFPFLAIVAHRANLTDG
jgi:hypothetical protein